MTAVTLEHKKPLKDMLDPEYKGRYKPLVKRMQDSLLWATEEFEVCVLRSHDKNGVETIRVNLDLASTPPPAMLAITFLRSLASTPPSKFTDTLMRISSNLARNQAATKTARRGKDSLDKAIDDAVPRARSAEAQARIDSLNRRIEANRKLRKDGK